MRKGILLCFAVILATTTAYAVPSLTLVWERNYTQYNLAQATLSGFNAFDVDKDGKMDIVMPFRRPTSRVLCVNGKDGSMKWIYPPMDQDGLPHHVMWSAAIDDMNGDGKYEILGQGRDRTLYCIDAATGKLNWKFEDAAPSGTDASTVLFDLNSDGKKEAVFCGYDKVYVVDCTGKQVWSFKMPGRGEVPVVWDVDRDGSPEVVTFDEEGIVFCLSSTGVEKWRFQMAGGSENAAPIIADFDKDGEYEIAINSEEDRCVYMLTYFGVEKWRFLIGKEYWEAYEAAGMQGGAFAAADMNGDGFIEMVIGDYIGNLYAVKHTGSQLWRHKLPNEIWTGILIVDFTGDGKLDVIVTAEGNETTAYPNGCVMILDAATGTEEFVWPAALSQAAPSAADITGRGYIEIVMKDAASGQVKVLTANAKLNPNRMPWPYWYKSLTNNAVYPIPEFALLLLPLGFALATWAGKRR